MLFLKQKKFIKKLLKNKSFIIKIYQFLMKDVNVLSHVILSIADVKDLEHFVQVYVHVINVLILK